MQGSITESMKKLEEQKEEILTKARTIIQEMVDRQHSHSHNVVSNVLRDVQKKLGTQIANSLVDEFELEEIFDIPKVEIELC